MNTVCMIVALKAAEGVPFCGGSGSSPGLRLFRYLHPTRTLLLARYLIASVSRAVLACEKLSVKILSTSDSRLLLLCSAGARRRSIHHFVDHDMNAAVALQIFKSVPKITKNGRPNTRVANAPFSRREDCTTGGGRVRQG